MRNSIAVDNELLTFNDTQQSKFMTYLETVEKNTVIFPIDSPNQLIVGNDFTTLSGKSKIAWVGLRQCCNFISKNFYKLITDICGKNAGASRDPSVYSDRDAATVFNIVVKRRFDKSLNGKRILKNNKTNLIESVVTDQYQRLSNFEFMTKVTKALALLGDKYTFMQSTMFGRKMQVRFVLNEPLNLPNFFAGKHLDPVRVGVLFSNSEYGDSAVKMTLFLSFGSLGSTIVPYSTALSIDHKGNNFFSKLDKLLVEIDNKRKELDESTVENMLTQLQNSNLGLSGVKEADDKWLKAINKKLVSHKIHSSVADKVLKRTLFSKIEDGVVILAKTDKASTWPDKTALDVFVAMLTESTKSAANMAVRDNIEQSAFKLLSGKLRF